MEYWSGEKKRMKDRVTKPFTGKFTHVDYLFRERRCTSKEYYCWKILRFKFSVSMCQSKTVITFYTTDLHKQIQSICKYDELTISRYTTDLQILCTQKGRQSNCIWWCLPSISLNKILKCIKNAIKYSCFRVKAVRHTTKYLKDKTRNIQKITSTLSINKVIFQIVTFKEDLDSIWFSLNVSCDLLPKSIMI